MTNVATDVNAVMDEQAEAFDEAIEQIRNAGHRVTPELLNELQTAYHLAAGLARLAATPVTVGAGTRDLMFFPAKQEAPRGDA